MKAVLHRKIRGAALIELAIGAPLLILVLLAADFCYEIIRAKLKLQEASRFAAWELTAFPLNDFGAGDHAAASASASASARASAERRYANVPCTDDRACGFTTRVSGLRVEMTDGPAFHGDGPRAHGPQNRNRFFSSLRGLFDRPVRAALEAFKFDPNGKITARASVQVGPGIIPSGWFSSSSSFRLFSRYTLIASSWNLADGSDATMRDKRAGNHSEGSYPHGLYTQVRRMTLAGVSDRLDGAFGLGGVFGLVGSGLPDPLGTFVVSHNFSPANRHGCNQTAGHTGKAGLNNSDGARRSSQRYTRLDFKLPKCFDTAPYQDVHAYRSSLYKRIYDQRGPHYLGSPAPMSEN